MKDSTRLIRLVGAVVVALVACYFVSLYSRTSMQVFSDRLLLPTPVAMLVKAERGAFVGPLVFLLLGISLIRKARGAALELVIAAAWVFAFAWMSLALLAWRFAEIPNLFVRPLLERNERRPGVA